MGICRFATHYRSVRDAVAVFIQFVTISGIYVTHFGKYVTGW